MSLDEHWLRTRGMRTNGLLTLWPLAHALHGLCTHGRLAFVLLALFALGACAAPERALPRLTDADYPGLLRSPLRLGPDVLWQQRVTAEWRDGGQRSFDAALQKQADVLTVLGLSPTGAVGFAVLQRGVAIEVQNRSGEPWPFPARFVLLDVQRVYFPWLATDGVARPDGVYTGTVEGEQVVEVVRAGRLQERRFTRLDGRPAGVLRIEYTWDRADWLAPTRAQLDNAWFGYRLTLETQHETRL